MEEFVIPWAFLIVSAVSGAFGSMLGIFLIQPQGSTLFWKTFDSTQRMLGGGIAAGLWNTMVSEYSGLVAGKVGHVIGVAGLIGFAWWFVMGGLSIYLNKFRQSGPSSIPLPGRFSWIGDLLSGITLKPPAEDKKIPPSIPPAPPTDTDGKKNPPVLRPPSVVIEHRETGGA